MPIFEYCSRKIYFTDSGNQNGKDFLFIHGWTSSQNVFKRQFDFFGREYRIIALDLLGHGHSDRLSPDEAGNLYGYPRMGDTVLALLGHLGISRAIVLGWSMGGQLLRWI